jgi:hypothetical protein
VGRAIAKPDSGETAKRLANMKIHLLFGDTNWLVRKNFMERLESRGTLFAAELFLSNFRHFFLAPFVP